MKLELKLKLREAAVPASPAPVVGFYRTATATYLWAFFAKGVLGNCF